MKMSEYVVESVFDGDLNTKIGNVDYSTSAREVITVGFMQDYYKGEMNNEEHK